MNGQYNSQKILRRDGKCVYCGSRENLTIDHVIPISRRREYRLPMRELNNYGNLVAACEECNEKKSSKSLEDFFNSHLEYKLNFLKNARYISDRILSAAGLN